MNVMMITSLNTYTSNMQMKMKWQQKKTSNDFTADGAMTMEERLRKDAKEAMGDLMGGGSKVSLGQIQTKLMSGKKLSAEEMDYLRENNPELYKKAKSIEMEREAYERELKQCKTKEEVQRVKMAHTTAALAQVKDIESNPNIPKGQKLALMMEQLFKSNALGDVERKFVQSGEYKRLPTEEEERQAKEDLKEAQDAERNIENKTDDTPQEVAEDAAAEEKAGTDDPVISADQEEKEGASDTSFAASGSSGQKPLFTESSRKTEKTTENTYSRNVRKTKAAAIDTQMTRIQAEATPEARKVKRARAQAAYTKTPNIGSSAGNVVDVKK